tara:strand:+ start:357 stop:1214 length:858 start_codon:yes stop_codon:yes gene_type:complete
LEIIKMQGGLRFKSIFKNSNETKPLISVITVVFNGEKYLEQAILSVTEQTYDNIEYIIIDGGSTDSTLDIIRKYEDYIDFWKSEKDKGIYNAMNKGISLCRGDFIGFVNADDYLYHDTLEKLADAIKKEKIDYTVGPVDIISKKGHFEEKANVLQNFHVKNRYIFEMATPHLSFYVSRKILKDIGPFDENFKIRADYDMTINVMSLSKKYYNFNKSVGAFRHGGVSGSYRTYFESFNILRKHNVSFSKSIINIIPSLIKVFITENFPTLIVNWLKKNFSSGRYIR